MNAPTCLNCKWARWTMTKHKPPRIVFNDFGSCTFKPITPSSWMCEKLPDSMMIFQANPYTDCAVWQASEHAN